MPKLWNDTVAEHRQAVRDAILESTWALVRERGLMSVTMSQVAERTGIGRATLYKYFPDVEHILLEFHRRHVQAHLRELEALAHAPGDARSRLRSVLDHYALICFRRGHGPDDLVALVHRPDQVDPAQRRLESLLGDLVRAAQDDGVVRRDASPSELAAYSLHALAAAGRLRSRAAVTRLVDVTEAGLRAT